MRDEDFVQKLRDEWQPPPASRDFDARLRARLERRPRWPFALAAAAALSLLWLGLRPTPEAPRSPAPEVAAAEVSTEAFYALMEPDDLFAEEAEEEALDVLPDDYLALADLLEEEAL